MEKIQKLPLENIRIVDFTRVRMGPQLTKWLSVMGAEVIMIETRVRVDTSRKMPTPGKRDSGEFSQAGFFATLNYGKKSITLNMRQPKAVELVKELVKHSDVVVENFGGAVMERWGLGYADLKKLKPDIIVFAGSGFGRTGPHRETPAYAPIIDAYSGLAFINGYPNAGPVPLGTGWADSVAALHGVFAILVALYHCLKTGEGQYIDLSMIETALAYSPESVLDYTINGRVQGRVGNRDGSMAPHGCYRCRGEDKWVAIAVSSDEEWIAFCNAIGNPEWTRKEDFSDALSRWKNQEELDRLIGEWTINHDHYDIMHLLQKAGVMAGASLNVKEVVNDPHLKQRGLLVDIEYPDMTKQRRAGLPFRLSNTSKGNYKYPPAFGEHNDYVFGELLGLSKEDIRQLEKEEVIY